MNVAEKVWFREARHVEEIQGSSLDIEYKDDWYILILKKLHKKFRHRIRERMKTVSVALVLCLNIGVDPPDIEYSNQGRKLSWVKPNTQSPQKAAQKIATHLQKLYEKLQPRAR